MVLLESADLFRVLDPEDIAAVRRQAEERTFAPGQEVFCAGDPGDGLYVVKTGRVEISGQLGTDGRQVFSQVGPGGVFGEMAVIEELPRSAFAVAAQTTTVYFVPRAVMVDLIGRTPALTTALLKLVSHRLRDFNQHYLREVVQAERLTAVGRFARSIIHDLKNPLNIINLTADMYGKPDATPQVRASAQARIHKQIERINDLVGDILQFTQTDWRPVLAPVNYATFIEQLTADLHPELELKAVRLELANAAPTVTLSLDAKRLRRVFFNLAHNAAEAMPGDGKITLRFSQEMNEVVTEMADTGSGIPPEMADKLFQPFATHGKSHGSGLGLSICKKIIADHGGRIWATNDPQGGAVFSFALPLAGWGSVESRQ